MKHTNYILELIIAGFGTLTWLLILFITLIDVNWVNIFVHIKEENITGLLALYSVFLLPFVYITGIVSDRMVDERFDILFANKIVKKYFVEKREYTKAIARIYYMSASLMAKHDYGRMRIRICRVWSFNAFMCFVVVNMFLFMRFEEFTILHKYINPEDVNIWTLSFYSTGFFLVSSLISFRAWYTLSEKECILLITQNELLIFEEKKAV